MRGSRILWSRLSCFLCTIAEARKRSLIQMLLSHVELTRRVGTKDVHEIVVCRGS